MCGDALVVRSRRATVRRVREQLRERLRRQQEWWGALDLGIAVEVVR